MQDNIYRDEDVDLNVLNGKTIAIVGYGSQGKAQAANLRDSGVNIIIGATDPKRYPDWAQAEADGFPVMEISAAVQEADIVHILLQDPAQPAVYYKHIHEHLKPGQTLSFAHGFAILYGTIQPPEGVDVVLFVPNGPGPVVRQKYLEGSGIYGAVGVDADASGQALQTILAIAKGAGSCRVGTVHLSFQKETEGDNFEEQVLYGGTITLMRSIYEIMAEAGYPKSFAYAKAVRSIRSVLDDMDEVGIEEYLTNHASRTCEFAVRSSGPRVINQDAVKQIFEETETGIFARNWLNEFNLGMPTLHRLRRNHKDSDMEQTGKEFREVFGIS